MNTFVVADIHGAAKALKQCLERSGFDKEKDTLIQMGDIVDRWSESYECVEELLTIKNLISIKGNHDDWWNEYIHTGIHPTGFKQGGYSTLMSYGINCLGKDWEKFQVKWDSEEQKVTTNFNPSKDIPETHKRFFNQQNHYYHDKENNRVFVHGGYTSHRGIGHEPYNSNYWWDRTLIESALLMQAIKNGLKYETNDYFPKRFEKHKEIYVGHTATTILGAGTTPLFAHNVIDLDTGCGGNGKLTIMNVDTKEYWQSDLTVLLYPDESIVYG